LDEQLARIREIASWTPCARSTRRGRVAAVTVTFEASAQALPRRQER
jgi:hypothetical protein